MAEAYIVAAVRTAGGRRRGRLAGWHPVDLGAKVLDAVVARAGVPGEAVDDVIVGCVTQAGEQALHVGRHCVLASGLPLSVPAVTIDRQCGSSQQAIQFAAQAVMSGTQDIVIAAGTESMTRVPMGSAALSPEGSDPLPASIKDRFGIQNFSQFGGAEMIAKKWGFTRDMLDAYGLESHLRAQRATKTGAFDAEILPLEIVGADGVSEMHTIDEGIRWDASPEGMAAVKLLVEGGVITAATSSQITDGASAVMIASEKAVKEYGLTPLARIVNMTVTAGDPVVMLEEPLFATDKAFARSGLKIGDIDLYEVNEAFAPVPMAWLKHQDADPAKLNVNGGAIALGHPLGASGTKLMTTLVYALKAQGKKYGLQTMCEGGGVANVTIVEAL
ncbi:MULTISPECIES: acetyl-CoA C-acetyltransferase [Sphingobium]|uniref:acetyl-CoA C-acetyltransferase n=1 Tax=Sphingobium TaxID=165695 RepID=UPI000C62DB81|nr:MULTISPECIES: acetyl-CoA C-acetyltransferase [Sphingobium]MBS48926.1 acetyl-CoA C-acyltransferase [Sphingobium sp.]MCC4256249.1 acetyl-CoA C-acetyltransferase [Sphingobium lactosutens]MEC9017305.1 acetyl-CoA C-acetyltransferase [Pseudomonadota bacterium]HCW62049.1 acetyl-CoA C-acetyltransferase [Sphingobium sp.]